MLALRTALAAVSVAAWTWASAGGYGYWVFHHFKHDKATTLEYVLFSSDAGYGILSLFMIALPREKTDYRQVIASVKI